MLGPSDLVCAAVPVAHVPLLERLAPLQASGFAGISVGVADYRSLVEWGLAPAEIRARIADAGLEVADIECVGLWLPGHEQVEGPWARALAGLTPEAGVEIAAALGARGLLVTEMLGLRTAPEAVAEAFARICDLAAPHGIVVHLEGVSIGAVPDLAAALAVVELAGRANGAVTIDPWHLFRSGGTLSQLAAVPAGRIGCVQLSDAPLVQDGDVLRETTTARLLPGEGEFDLVGLVRVLDAIGSGAPITLEVFHRDNRKRSMSEIADSWAVSARRVLDAARATPYPSLTENVP